MDVEAGGTWDGNGLPVTVRVDTGQSLRWAGDQFVTGDIVGDFSAGSPGKVRMEGIKTSSTSATLDFPESPVSPGFANAYMLEWNGVELRGDPWTIDGFVRTWITAPSAGPQATVTADTTLIGEIAQQSPQVLINADAFTNSGTYRAIGSASDSLQGTGTWINDGTFRRQPPSGTSTFLDQPADMADDHQFDHGGHRDGGQGDSVDFDWLHRERTRVARRRHGVVAEQLGHLRC